MWALQNFSGKSLSTLLIFSNNDQEFFELNGKWLYSYTSNGVANVYCIIILVVALADSLTKVHP